MANDGDSTDQDQESISTGEDTDVDEDNVSSGDDDEYLDNNLALRRKRKELGEATLSFDRPRRRGARVDNYYGYRGGGPKTPKSSAESSKKPPRNTRSNVRIS